MEVNNLISIRQKTSPAQAQALLVNLVEYVKTQGANRTGLPISTTYSMDAATQMMDIEFYLPIDKEIPSTGEFVYKPLLHLSNCLRMTYKGNPQFFQKACEDLNQYMAQNKLVPITTGFNVNRNEVTKQEDLEQFEVDVYVSINPNVF